MRIMRPGLVQNRSINSPPLMQHFFWWYWFCLLERTLIHRWSLPEQCTIDSATTPNPSPFSAVIGCAQPQSKCDAKLWSFWELDSVPVRFRPKRRLPQTRLTITLTQINRFRISRAIKHRFQRCIIWYEQMSTSSIPNFETDGRVQTSMTWTSHPDSVGKASRGKVWFYRKRDHQKPQRCCKHARDYRPAKCKCRIGARFRIVWVAYPLAGYVRYEAKQSTMFSYKYLNPLDNIAWRQYTHIREVLLGSRYACTADEYTVPVGGFGTRRRVLIARVCQSNLLCSLGCG